MGNYTFEIKKKIRGVKLTDEVINELKENGSSHVMKLINNDGKQYLAHLEIVDGKITVVPEVKYLEHRCPHCGGRMVVTSKGYFCEHSLGDEPTCKYHCNGLLSHRIIKPFEIEAFLAGKPTILDGCFNSMGKIFSAVLTEDEEHGMALTSVVGKCPICGGDVLVSPVAFNCTCHHQIGEPYHFSLWRNIRGHAVTLEELDELLNIGITSREVELNSSNGSISKARLRLSKDKKRIIPDFIRSNYFAIESHQACLDGREQLNNIQ